MLKQILLLNFILLSIALSFSQNDILIELNDSETAEPVAFATVRFKGTNRGLVSDYYGQFRLPYKSVDSLPVIVISSLGYKIKEVNTKTLDLKVLNKIQLVPQIESLDAVVLNISKRNKAKGAKLKTSIGAGKTLSAYEIVDLAVNSVSDNISNIPHSYIGYYRDYQKVGETYNNLNEGILEQFDSGILTDKMRGLYNQNAFYSFNQNQNYNINNDLAASYNNSTKYVEGANIMGFGGNELTLLNVHNPIRNYNQNTFSYVYQLNKDFLLNHSFNKGDITFADDEALVKISFSKKRAGNQSFGNVAATSTDDISNRHRVTGSISISLTDFSIHEFTYTVYDGNRQNPLFNVQIEYRKENDKMYLNYITFNNRFVVQKGNAFKETDIVFDKGENAFDIEFNKNIDPTTVTSRNFRIKNQGKKVFIESVEVTGDRSVRVKIKDFDDSLAKLDNENLLDVDFEIKRLKDVNGAKIYKPMRLIAYQFREFFVQEVFTDKALKKDLSFISKSEPLNGMSVNSLSNKDDYIINSPLREVDAQNKD